MGNDDVTGISRQPTFHLSASFNYNIASARGCGAGPGTRTVCRLISMINATSSVDSSGVGQLGLTGKPLPPVPPTLLTLFSAPLFVRELPGAV